jgi:hypothetical protein
MIEISKSNERNLSELISNPEQKSLFEENTKHL